MSEIEIPSTVPVEGWARGVDGNWWPPTQPRQLPISPERADAPRRSRRSRRVLTIVAVLIVLAAIAALVVGIVSTIRTFEDRPTSKVGEASHVTVVGLAGFEPTTP